MPEIAESAIAADTDGYDPLDDPEIAAQHNRIKQLHGQIAADRYLLKVQANPNTVTNSNGKSQEQEQIVPEQPEPALTDTESEGEKPTEGSIDSTADTTAVADSVETDETAYVTTALEPITVESEATEADPADLALGETDPAEPAPVEVVPGEPAATDSETETAQAPVTSPDGETCLATEGDKPERTSKRRKPVRSTAQVKQAFEEALAEFVAADKPFRRSHVLKAAELGAGFYDTYPSLRARVDQAIANVGKAQSQPQVEVKPVNSNTSDNTTRTSSALPVDLESGGNDTTSRAGAKADTGQLATAEGHVLSLNGEGGLTWDEIRACEQHWRQEKERLVQEIQALELQLNDVVANARAYQRILRLHNGT